ncbi:MULTISPECIES: LacI family DNA-binding transcriptional regulator [unclassified Actinomyces]|uniref:LacI family DNA-binding transcriptional regulator n=3 Tax=Actinomyces TaxID=1654 RepID=UPI0020179313|nr:LacI family DNA-binding transcriptional regulator [Actinomyces sp. 187325]MCL3777135.1 LacI family DNA-binding transcriptional regulator [Actinomyces sp. AC-20-1]MCL3788949.1 LacI family DNA-binding transcriptional regulator [Actinomyces sp. 187325]MCL3791321.1 LacI family DNA-binding transcriptional regulator [Actinomyces sp. 186855]MCL3794152.1 LacI family DNA-binding transcriptional regulator [Actinomyces sp. 217892]
MTVTMRQVADRAGVSLKSVSRVVNGEPNVSPRLRSRVTAAVEELGWRPNALARSLRTGRTSTVAVLVPDMRAGWVTGLVQAVVLEADRRGLRVAIEPCGHEPERVAQVLTEQATSFDGALVLGDVHDDLTEVGSLSSVPVCRAGWWREDGRTRHDGGVRLDLAHGADIMSRHLRALRLERPLVLGPGAGREGSYVAELLARMPGSGLLETGPRATRAEGHALAPVVAGMAPVPDVVVCADDDLALGLAAGLRRAGVSVPGSLAVCGCGGLEDGRFSSPSLTSLVFPVDEIARAALSSLERRMGGGAGADGAGEVCVLAPSLVRRESTLGAGPVAGGTAGAS